MRKHKTGGFLYSRWAVLVGLVLMFLGGVCFFAGEWYLENYGTLGFESILYTLTANLDGVQSGLVTSFAKQVGIRVLLFFSVIGFALFYPFRNRLVLKLKGKKTVRVRLYPFRRPAAFLLSICIAAGTTAAAAVRTEFVKFLYYLGSPSVFYEETYVDPRNVQITFPEEKRNLICIYLESMETTFFSEEEGGALEQNMVPELHALAQEHINFSHNDGVGGFFSPSGTQWTVAALLSQSAGIPLKTTPETGTNGYGADGTFLPGIDTLSDILAENGYHQMVMFGSDATFGGRYAYYSSHGVQEVRDLFTAREDGIVPEDYYTWWGMEDEHLYTYAKQELTKLASGEEPFAFTMLTADTHHVDGYLCRLCENTRLEQYENVFRCASRQAADFISWLQQQPFYENTTIVIAGDHPSMDADYFSRQVDSDYDRRVYNCYINSALQTGNFQNRQFTAMDMFPTTLAAMGCRIEGEQLGLGINLFSGRPTLMEQLGQEALNDELSRYSEFYMTNFLQ